MAILGTFAFEENFLTAAKNLTSSGFDRISLMSPIPVEEAQEIVGLHKSRVRHFSLAGAIIGCIGGFAMAVGTARSAYEYTLDWCKTYTGGGLDPIINHQNVGYMLTDIATKIEASRYLCYKSGFYADKYDNESWPTRVLIQFTSSP